MALAQTFHGVTELGERAGLEVLDEHVGLGQDGLKQALVFGLAEVGDHGLLAAVEPSEMRALAVHQTVVMTRKVTLGPLQLDDTSPGVSQLATGKRGGHCLVERKHEDAGKRFHRGEDTCKRPRRARLCMSAPAPNSHGGASVESSMRLARRPSSGAEIVVTSPPLWVKP